MNLDNIIYYTGIITTIGFLGYICYSVFKDPSYGADNCYMCSNCIAKKWKALHAKTALPVTDFKSTFVSDTKASFISTFTKVNDLSSNSLDPVTITYLSETLNLINIL